MKRKNIQKLQLVALILMVVLVTSGCVSYDDAGNPTGWVYQFLGLPASDFLDFLANSFNGNYGVAILITTIITRLFMLPSTLKMTRTSMETQAKTKLAQPEIDALRKRQEEATTQEEKMKAQQEMMDVYKKYDINVMASMSGCLPLLLQMPIISAVYTAISVSPEIKNYTFMGTHLGERSIFYVVLVVLVYFIQGWLTQRQMPVDDSNPAAAQTSRSMMIMNPLMLGWISYISPAGLALYFLAGGVFALLQQLYVNVFVRPKIQAKIDEQAEKYAPLARDIKEAKPVVKEEKERLVPVKEEVQPSFQKRRNEGKQNR